MDGQNFQNNPYGQPVPPEEPKKTDTLAIISLVMGIASIVLCCCRPYLGVVLGIGGIICSIISIKNRKNGLAIAGLICSIIALVLLVILIIFGAVAITLLESQGYDISNFLNY